MADGLVLALALLGVACLPVAVAAVVCADELIDRAVCGLGDWREQRRERRTIARLDQLFSVEGQPPRTDAAELDRIERPSLEQIAADLRRLGRQRLNVGNRSGLWQSAVQQAYDERLRLASRALGIDEHLAGLAGVDLEIERVRVEGELQAAGLRLPGVAEQRGRRP
ncbi:hypothetical protein [Plantactinospora sp. KBS50]|uniref:hypothetical protein n=1 Tax=Plantactinospora sp. KBS50 TaxID=2024580 RepID=UPI000BAAB135|nr:hypothetical protein [Plantactinospora sp. KBS50]ASW53330.1 hypothetical protein CIK06_02725 [Plantactinospora sp. KBS50]